MKSDKMQNARGSWLAFGLMAVGELASAQTAFPISGSAVLGAQYDNQANDPMQIEMLFKEGNAIVDILKGLKDKGFAIDFKEKQIPPSMTLLSLPKGTRIDEVLREILAPWNLSLYHSPYGRWVVRPDKKKPSTPPPSTGEQEQGSDLSNDTEQKQ